MPSGQWRHGVSVCALFRYPPFSQDVVRQMAATESVETPQFSMQLIQYRPQPGKQKIPSAWKVSGH